MSLTNAFATPAAVQAVYDAIPAPVYVKDRQHRLVLVNRALTAMMGLEPAELLGRSDADFYGPEDAAHYWAIDDQVFATGEMVETEEALHEADVVRYLITRKQIVQIETPTGPEPFIVAVISDVTASRKAEARATRAARLRECEARVMGAIAANAPLEDLLRIAAEAMGEVTAGGRACIYLPEEGDGVLRLAAAPWLAQPEASSLYRVQVDPTTTEGWDDAREGAVLVAYPENHPMWADYQDMVREHQLRTCWWTLVADSEGRLLAALGVYHAKLLRESRADLAAMAQMRDLIAIAIERTRQEEKLFETQQRFDQLANAIDDTFWIVDGRTGEFVYMSPGYSKLTGSDLEAIYKNPRVWTEAIHEDDRQRVRDTVRRGTDGFRIEYRLRRSDGTMRWISNKAFPVRDAQGKVFRIAGLTHDVTALKDAEAAAHANMQRAQAETARRHAIFDAASDMILTVDCGGRIESINRAGELMLGYPPGELVGKLLSGRLNPGPGRPANLSELLERVRRHEPGTPFELELVRRDGSILQVDANFGELSEARGIHFVAILRDSTERKRVERSKDEFISTVSHELRTPLTSIAGSLGLLTGGAAGEMPDKAKRLISIAENNSRRLVRLINDILDIEKMQSGAMKFAFAPVDLGELATRAVEAMGGLAVELGVRFQLLTPEGHAIIRGDADRLTQVITNLLSNAAKFSPRDQAVEVAVALEGGRARISVRDSGPGIPAEFRSRIFGKFAQADASDRRQKGGTGLGLAICKQIVERHGGRIWFDSSPGEGATFHVELPLEKAVSGEVATSATEAPRDPLAQERSFLPAV
ncbi:PAS domain S-box protein [Phenylobacterium sp.]|uniref:PAS domain S-box protein n=1 Tax=Phenylobacterium sp. TaxID=1871053 RepID=UPI0028123019|nr:PAS domain S-box protein [Phenylobacterium sp.]